MNDDCPMGDECAIHFRKDEDTVDSDVYVPRLITYLDDVVVITDEHSSVLRKVFGPRYDTTVIRVGSEGTLSDFWTMDIAPGDESKYLLFEQSHNDLDAFRDRHDMVVSMARDGLFSDRLELDCE